MDKAHLAFRRRFGSADAAQNYTLTVKLPVDNNRQTVRVVALKREPNMKRYLTAALLIAAGLALGGCLHTVRYYPADTVAHWSVSYGHDAADKP